MNPPDLSRLVNNSMRMGPQQRGSGYAINMPDGAGNVKPVPVELATPIMLDHVVRLLQELIELVKRQEAGEVGG